MQKSAEAGLTITGAHRVIHRSERAQTLDRSLSAFKSPVAAGCREPARGVFAPAISLP